jgi:hypothetical protein
MKARSGAEGSFNLNLEPENAAILTKDLLWQAATKPDICSKVPPWFTLVSAECNPAGRQNTVAFSMMSPLPLHMTKCKSDLLPEKFSS